MPEALSRLFQNMTNVINTYYYEEINALNKRERSSEIKLIVYGVNLYLKYLKKNYKDKFWQVLDPQIRKSRFSYSKARLNQVIKTKIEEEKDGFTKYVLNNYQGYKKIFLDRDSYTLYLKYFTQSKRNDVINILYTRRRLLGKNNGEDYFNLTNLAYTDTNLKGDFKRFFATYKSNLEKNQRLLKITMVNTDTIFKKERILEKIKPYKKILIIDTGIQAGLISPLYVYLERLGFEVDFCMYTCVAWMYPLFKNKVYTKDISLLEMIEKESAKFYHSKHE